MLRIIDRYMINEFVRPLLFGVALFSSLIIVTVVLGEALRFIQRYELPPGLLLRFLAYGAPEFILLSIPMGTLLGTLLAVGRLNGDHEIVALRACGLSLWRLLTPFMVIGALLAAITIMGTEYIVPWTRTQLLELKNSVRRGELGVRQQRVLIPIREGGQLRWVLSAAELEGARLRDIDLLYIDPQNPGRDFAVRAAEATWTGNHWNFRDLRQVSVQQEGSQQELLRLRTEELDLPEFAIRPEDLEEHRRAAADVSARQLAGYIADLERGVTEAADVQEQIDALQELGQEVRERVAEDREQRVLIPFYEGEELRWLLIADRIERGQLFGARLLYYDQDPAEDFAVTASRMSWTGDRWLFYGMRQVRVDPAVDEQNVIQEAEVGQLPDFNMPPQSLELRMQTAEDMSAFQLRQRIAELRTTGDPVDRREILDLRTKLHFKYSIPLTPLFFIFIAFPLTILPQRASNTRGMGIALMLVLSYYALYTVFEKLGATGALPPVLAAWCPNLMLGFTGWFLMQRRQHS